MTGSSLRVGATEETFGCDPRMGCEPEPGAWCLEDLLSRVSYNWVSAREAFVVDCIDLGAYEEGWLVVQSHTAVTGVMNLVLDGIVRDIDSPGMIFLYPTPLAQVDISPATGTGVLQLARLRSDFPLEARLRLIFNSASGSAAISASLILHGITEEGCRCSSDH